MFLSRQEMNIAAKCPTTELVGMFELKAKLTGWQIIARCKALTPETRTRVVDSIIGLVADEGETIEVLVICQVRCDVFVDLDKI